jgi:hypothetical protein
MTLEALADVDTGQLHDHAAMLDWARGPDKPKRNRGRLSWRFWLRHLDRHKVAGVVADGAPALPREWHAARPDLPPPVPPPRTRVPPGKVQSTS